MRLGKQERGRVGPHEDEIHQELLLDLRSKMLTYLSTNSGLPRLLLLMSDVVVQF